MKTAFCIFVWFSVLCVATCEQCLPWWDWWSDQICCDQMPLGCFGSDSPYDTFRFPCCPEGDEVTYKLYTSATSPGEYIKLDDPLPSSFSGSRKSMFVIHGFTGSGEDASYLNMKNELFAREPNLNVILPSYESSLDYYYTASYIRVVGKLTALIMQKLVDEGGESYSDIYCVGHSLGAHTCGFAGRNTPQPIGRITGLDPASPQYEGISDITVGLNSGDATMVDVIHTDTKDIGRLGTIRSLGTVDFYVNGLEIQPGCLLKKKRRRRRGLLGDFASCSHSRAFELYLESIQSSNCVAQSVCTDINDMPTSCTACSGDCAVMGYDMNIGAAAGNYYITTDENGLSPHC